MDRVKKILTCIVCSAVTGCVSGCAVYFFRRLAGLTAMLSEKAFAVARENALFIPLIIAAGASLGLLASIILKREPDSAGGGIPSSIAAIRDVITLRPLRSFVSTLVSSTLTYAAGIPLGTEGPCVLLGSSVGGGLSVLAGKHSDVFRRYAMTGGACAGFAAATGAPICGVIFAIEEVHKKLRPAVIVTAVVSVVFGVTSHTLLCRLTSFPYEFFPGIDVIPQAAPPIPLSLIVGAVCGLCSAGFTALHTLFGVVIKKKLSRLPLAVKLSSVFALCVAVGCFSESFTGTGHHLTEHLLAHTSPLRAAAVIFLVRAVLLIVANNAGVTGGTFIPNLTLGALIGTACAVVGQALGLVSADLAPLTVALGMCAYLGAVSKTPLLAIVFGIEALGCLRAAPSLCLACIIAYYVMHAFGIKEFADVAIEAKIEKRSHGCEESEYYADVTAEKGSFAHGMSARDLLLPYGCSIWENDENTKGSFRVRCVTGDKKRTEGELSRIFGTRVVLHIEENDEKEINHGTEE